MQQLFKFSFIMSVFVLLALTGIIYADKAVATDATFEKDVDRDAASGNFAITSGQFVSADFQNALNALTQQNSALSAAVESLTSKVESLTSKVESLTTDNKALSSTVQSLTSKVESLTTDNKALSSTVQSLTTSNKAFDSATQALSANITSLWQTVNQPKVYFDAYRTSSWKKTNSIVTYDGTNANSGNGLNITTGIFTAPQAGVYQFLFIALLINEHVNNSVFGSASLYKNGQLYASSQGGGFKLPQHLSFTLGMTAILPLSKGDTVFIHKDHNDLAFIDTEEGRFTHFTGVLIQ